MIKYSLKKLAYGFLVLQGVILILFFLFNVLPVNSARMTLGQRTDEETVKAKEKELRLNLPVWKRYLCYLNDLSPLSLHSSNPESTTFAEPRFYKSSKLFTIGSYELHAKWPYLGRSFQSGRGVMQMIYEKLPNTLLLAFGATLLASIIGITFGIIAALRQNTWIDHVTMVVSTLGISQPSYFIGILFLLLFAIVLKDFTHLNIQGSLFELNDFGDPVMVWKNVLLPVLALGVRPIAVITQLTRSSMLETISQDFIRTAKAKGLPRNVVIVKHALRNAMNPVITGISGWFASLLAGSFFVEVVFNYKGLGNLTVNALMSFDFPVVMGCVLYVASIFILINLITDLLYGVLDPRISVR